MSQTNHTKHNTHSIATTQTNINKILIVHVYVYTYMYLYIETYIYIYIYVDTHTNRAAHSPRRASKRSASGESATL